MSDDKIKWTRKAQYEIITSKLSVKTERCSENSIFKQTAQKSN